MMQRIVISMAAMLVCAASVGAAPLTPQQQAYKYLGRVRFSFSADTGTLESNARIQGNPKNFTDEGLAHLAALPNPRHLGLADTSISDDGLALLTGLATLETLDLKRTRITDTGLAHVAKMTGLRRLDLSDTQVTGAGLAT